MRILLRKQRLDNGGYLHGGKYYGNVPGTSIYTWETDMDYGNEWGVIRATSRDDARNQLLTTYPHAKIRR